MGHAGAQPIFIGQDRQAAWTVREAKQDPKFDQELRQMEEPFRMLFAGQQLLRGQVHAAAQGALPLLLITA